MSKLVAVLACVALFAATSVALAGNKVYCARRPSARRPPGGRRVLDGAAADRFLTGWMGLAAAIATAAHNVLFPLARRDTGTTRDYGLFHAVVTDVNQACVRVGSHFRNSDQQGSNLGRKVSRYVVDHFFQQEQR